ncbi:MAG TPA: hypothetical protein VHZ33_25435 [Trebonia sp.]|jgi:hypothetical protein|nr:hypothetical protein [Trebonia sp.]
MDIPNISHDSDAGHGASHDGTPLHTGVGAALGADGHDYRDPYDDQSQALGASATGSELGNPNEYEHYWFYQGKDGYCAPSSVTQVIEAQSGHSIDGYSAAVSEAHKLGIPFDGSGMTMPQAQELLNGFGVQSHLEQPASAQQGLDELAQYLEQGKSVILSVNADPIWYGTETSSDNPDGGPDHALVVTAINAQTGEVTLSDPGSPDGNQEQVPLSTFMEAWEASGCEMLVTDHAAGTEDAQVWSDTERIEGIATDTVHHGETEAGFVIVSIALGMGVRRAARAARARMTDDQRDAGLNGLGEIGA